MTYFEIWKQTAVKKKGSRICLKVCVVSIWALYGLTYNVRKNEEVVSDEVNAKSDLHEQNGVCRSSIRRSKLKTAQRMR